MKLLNLNEMCHEIHVKLGNLDLGSIISLNVEHVLTLMWAGLCVYMQKMVIFNENFSGPSINFGGVHKLHGGHS